MLRKKAFLLTLVIGTTAFPQTWNETDKITAFDRGAGDYFGLALDMSNEFVLVGAPTEDEDEMGGNTMASSGSAYFFGSDINGGWTQIQKVVASDREGNNWFGYGVAIDGDYAIIGADGQNYDAAGGGMLVDAGAAYIFMLDSGGTWIETQKLVASDRDANDDFGIAVSISGNYAIVGAFHEDEDALGGATLNLAGSAYIFERDSLGNWTEVQKLVASDRVAGDRFGTNVAIHGNYAACGVSLQSYDSSGGAYLNAAGAVYIFERDSLGTWSEVQKIVASDRTMGDGFGVDVDVFEDHLIVGASGQSTDETGTNFQSGSGAGYIFERDSAGVWVEVQKIVASDRDSYDNFGHSVAIIDKYLIVAAHWDEHDEAGLATASSAGSAYIFEMDGMDVWHEIQKIVASDREMQDEFGYSVSISGNKAAVGALKEDEDTLRLNTLAEAGSAYVFEYFTVGISENETENMVAAFPNPNTGIFTLELQEPGTINIYSMTGHLVQVRESVKGSIRFDITTEPSGLYLVLVTTEKGIYSLKVIKH